VGALRGGPSCEQCPFAETIPPLDPFATRTAEPSGPTTTLANLQQSVTQAEINGGGWVQFVFHGICDGCGASDATSPATMTAFLDWLSPRSASGTVVKTVAEVMGAGAAGFSTTPADRVAPTATITSPANGATVAAGTTVPINVAAEDTGGSNLAKVSVRVNGQLIGTDTVAPYTVNWSTPRKGRGRIYTVVAEAQDNAGNIDRSPSISLTLNR
jgi:hypothetical protein